MSSYTDVLDQFERLRIEEGDIQSTVLTYTGWVNRPHPSFLNPDQTTEALTDIIRNHLRLGLRCDELPSLRDKATLAPQIIIKPYEETIAPDPKPNMLIAVASLFYCEKRKSPNCTVQSLMSALGKYDIIMPRKPLQTLITKSTDDFNTYVYRAYKGGPLFIDRTSSYSTNPGAIGMQFESNLINLPENPMFRNYGIFSVGVRDVRLMVTGEIDAIATSTGNPIEIKTKPAWVRFDNSRALQTWAQASIANVQTIVTGRFETQKGARNRPVTFRKPNIEYQTVREFGRNVSGKKEGVDNANRILCDIMETCGEIGCVYRAKGNTNHGVDLEILADGAYDFPISLSMIRQLAEIVRNQ